MRRYIGLLLLLTTLFTCNRQAVQEEVFHAPFLQIASPEVDSILQTLSLEQKLGQLLIQHTSCPTTHLDSLLEDSRNGLLGGLLMDQLPIAHFLDVLDTLQEVTTQPLFVATEELVNLNNQFADLADFPEPATIGAIQNDSLRQLLETIYLRQCQALGINLAFAPGLQLASPTDTIYMKQAFESDPETVLHRTSRQLEALQKRHILAIANQWQLPASILRDTSKSSYQQIHRFRNLSFNGLSGLLASDFVADTISTDLPAHYLANGLKEQLEFKGLLVGKAADAAALQAQLLAGMDLFVVEGSMRVWRDSLRALFDQGVLTQYVLDEKVRKILKARAWINQPSTDVVAEKEIDPDLLFRSPHYPFMIRQLYERGLVLAQNAKEVLPFKSLKRQKFRLFSVGKAPANTFQRFFAKYAKAKQLFVDEQTGFSLPTLTDQQLKRSTLVFSLQNLNLKAKQDSLFIETVNEWAKQTAVVLVNFGNPANLVHFDSTVSKVAIFEFNALNESLAAQLLFGALQAEGQLPVALAEHLPFGKKTETPILRLKYTVPEEVGMASYKLVGIDAIFQSAIAAGAMPGGQVLVAKEGKIIYSKNFGHHTYRKERRVRASDVYDLASVSKIAATTMAAMKLHDEKKLRIGDPLRNYLKMDPKSALRKISLRRLFTHSSGLQSNMPIAPMINLRDTTEEWGKVYASTPKAPFTIPVADSIFLNEHYLDSMWLSVLNLKPRRRKRYRYSDVNFNLIQRVIEETTNKKLNQYCWREFYQPLHLRNTTFQPWQHLSRNRIVPTVEDERWRTQLIQGYPHDETAALMGGVSGNAGLFSNAEDMAILFQLLLNGGHYGGDTLLTSEVIDYFTSAKHGNHRGLGFDKPRKRRVPSYSRKAPKSTYGHTGYTGTCVWVDPDKQLTYIFLANRVHPNPRNRTLFKKKVRSRIHNVIYEAIDSYEPTTLFEPIKALKKGKSVEVKAELF